MIVSDRFGFIFIHIPKCAGTSVRRALEDFHDGAPHFVESLGHHPAHGELDFTHLPLNLLAEIDPDVFAKLRSYATFAIVRDPMQRFQSAMAQRAKMYLKSEIAQLGEADIAAELDRVMSYLRSVPQVTAPEFIHFSRQSDFVFMDGERLVQTIFPVERLDDLAAAIGDTIGGTELAFGHANQTTVFRYPHLRQIAQTGSQQAKRLMPEPLHRWVRKSARRMMMKPKAQALLPAFDTAGVRDFVAEYYASDYDLHRGALQRACA
ncbi:hypothetical protein DDZ14_07350 [Maritimibacter sp. 55A14]|uniref:sulfotransferase family 2 domain-containing protein n=1 Tax=Maritimibacter sp. 55A14 TaxID=2174844 RepID=UPI000D62082F|nr:sulfotransferase family 2 domain-containing protein [Maritimibacter sp. 55A14]PWE32901.1 hypothetical protein DDZ14_07350 [Maritimibacter sp. 55A14]